MYIYIPCKQCATPRCEASFQCARGKCSVGHFCFEKRVDAVEGLRVGRQRVAYGYVAHVDSFERAPVALNL